jgi:hypothetical protein
MQPTGKTFFVSEQRTRIASLALQFSYSTLTAKPPPSPFLLTPTRYATVAASRSLTWEPTPGPFRMISDIGTFSKP